MKKNLKQLVIVLILAIMIFPASVRAEGNNCFGDDLKGVCKVRNLSIGNIPFIIQKLV